MAKQNKFSIATLVVAIIVAVPAWAQQVAVLDSHPLIGEWEYRPYKLIVSEVKLGDDGKIRGLTTQYFVRGRLYGANVTGRGNGIHVALESGATMELELSSSGKYLEGSYQSNTGSGYSTTVSFRRK